MYFVISVDKDGVEICCLDKTTLEQRLNGYHWGRDVIFQSTIPIHTDDPNNWPEGVWIIKGDLIIPRRAIYSVD